MGGLLLPRGLLEPEADAAGHRFGLGELQVVPASGQGGDAAMHFATAPKRLTLQEWNAPKSYPCDDGKPCDPRYTVSDVFYSEACVLLRICRNGNEVFKIERGQPFHCDVDVDGYRDFVRDLLRTSLNIDTRVEDYYERR